jgi:hypothetical protein
LVLGKSERAVLVPIHGAEADRFLGLFSVTALLLRDDRSHDGRGRDPADDGPGVPAVVVFFLGGLRGKLVRARPVPVGFPLQVLMLLSHLGLLLQLLLGLLRLLGEGGRRHREHHSQCRNQSNDPPHGLLLEKRGAIVAAPGGRVYWTLVLLTERAAPRENRAVAEEEDREGCLRRW